MAIVDERDLEQDKLSEKEKEIVEEDSEAARRTNPSEIDEKDGFGEIRPE
jgi:hypothetical protein